jgi:alpha-D-ribose 1-methylphosphonate 5-triphosphate synthase subunit PhnL
MTILTVDNLSKTFAMHVLGETHVIGLDDVSFAVDEGEFLGIVGRSGSGKSSLLKCLYRTYEPTGGHARYESRNGPIDLATCPERKVLALRGGEIGYASQFLNEIPRVPAVDVVARPLRESGMAPADARDKAADILKQLQLPDDLFEAYPATFSGGERQRVNLARAIAPHPRLLLLDEPTSALDSETRGAAIDLLRSYLDDGTTIIGVFHKQDVVEKLTDRVVVLDNATVNQVTDTTAYVAEVAE